MIPMDMAAVQVLIATGRDWTLDDIHLQLIRLKSQMKELATEEVAALFESIMLQEQARIITSYKDCIESAKTQEDHEFLSDVMTEDIRLSCEEFVDFIAPEL